MKLYYQTILDTVQNVLVNNADDCNMCIIVTIQNRMIFMYKGILLMYDHLHSYMMIYTTVLYIVCVCTCRQGRTGPGGRGGSSPQAPCLIKFIRIDIDLI